MNKLNLDTNSTRGTYSYGDPHPTVDGRFFACIRKVNGSTKELWITKNTLDNRSRYFKAILEARKIPKIKRETLAEYKTWSSGDVHPYLPDLVFKCYLKGVEKWETTASRIKRFACEQACRKRSKQRDAERKKQHRADNMADYVARARARKKNIAISLKDLGKGEKQLINEIYKFRDILNRIHEKIVFVVDHIHPLAKGGLHSPCNLQLSTWEYNAWKSAKVNVTPNDFKPY